MKRYAARARAQLTYANVIATSALFIALGGGAWALAKDSVGSREIENGSVRSQELKDDDVRGADIEANAVEGSDVIADSLTGADVNESGLTAGGALTGSLGNAGIADGAVDADAIGALPVARLEIPRDASNCASQLTVASGAVVDIPWAISSEAGGLAPIPPCATDVIVPVGGFYLTTVTVTWDTSGGAANVTLEIERGSSVIAAETIPFSGGDQDHTVAMATSVAAGAPLRARLSHDGGAGATIRDGEMVVHYLGAGF